MVIAWAGAAAILASGRRHRLESLLMLFGLAVPAVGLPLALALVAVARRRATGSETEVMFLHAVAAELRAGAGLRAAVCAAAESVPEMPLSRMTRLARVGAPMERVADEVATALPTMGAVASAAFVLAAQTGGKVADVFEGLALLAAEDRELGRELRAATAQARISAWLVGGLPMVFLGFGVATGRTGDLLTSPVGLILVTVGGGLVAVGVAAVATMLKRALR